MSSRSSKNCVIWRKFECRVFWIWESVTDLGICNQSILMFLSFKSIAEIFCVFLIRSDFVSLLLLMMSPYILILPYGTITNLMFAGLLSNPIFFYAIKSFFFLSKHQKDQQQNHKKYIYFMRIPSGTFNNQSLVSFPSIFIDILSNLV
jgi:hypothetical protein